MCSIFSSCWKRDKGEPDVQAQAQGQGQGQVQNIIIRRNDSLPSKDYNLYVVQKNIQQLLDLQKLQMEYLKEIEKLHNKKDE